MSMFGGAGAKAQQRAAEEAEERNARARAAAQSGQTGSLGDQQRNAYGGAGSFSQYGYDESARMQQHQQPQGQQRQQSYSTSFGYGNGMSYGYGDAHAYHADQQAQHTNAYGQGQHGQQFQYTAQDYQQQQYEQQWQQYYAEQEQIQYASYYPDQQQDMSQQHGQWWNRRKKAQQTPKAKSQTLHYWDGMEDMDPVSNQSSEPVSSQTQDMGRTGQKLTAETLQVQQQTLHAHQHTHNRHQHEQQYQQQHQQPGEYERLQQQYEEQYQQYMQQYGQYPDQQQYTQQQQQQYHQQTYQQQQYQQAWEQYYQQQQQYQQYQYGTQSQYPVQQQTHADPMAARIDALLSKPSHASSGRAGPYPPSNKAGYKASSGKVRGALPPVKTAQRKAWDSHGNPREQAMQEQEQSVAALKGLLRDLHGEGRRRPYTSADLPPLRDAGQVLKRRSRSQGGSLGKKSPRQPQPPMIRRRPEDREKERLNRTARAKVWSSKHEKKEDVETTDLIGEAQDLVSWVSALDYDKYMTKLDGMDAGDGVDIRASIVTV